MNALYQRTGRISPWEPLGEMEPVPVVVRTTEMVCFIRDGTLDNNNHVIPPTRRWPGRRVFNLGEAAWREMGRLYDSGLPTSFIAKRFECGQTYVRKHWLRESMSP